jgi:hypothetical protein
VFLYSFITIKKQNGGIIVDQNVEKLYLTEKEAAIRYGYSRTWFQRARWAGNSPAYLKINSNSNGRGRVLYPILETDDWFSNHGLKTSTSGVAK